MGRRVAVAVAFALAVTGTTLSAETLEQRVGRLESKLNSQALVDMVQRLDAMQLEVQQLRGQVEERDYQIEQMRKRQRELYLDADRRLSRLEREGGAVAPVSAPSTGLVGGPAAAAATTAAATSASTPAPLATTPPPPSPEQLKRERDAYQKAFDLLKELRYEEASKAFRGFIEEYPNGRYAHIAQYWLGEGNYARRKFKAAITDYRALLANYPNSPKLAEALLKIGYSYNELGNRGDATKALTELTSKYPGTTEAGQAEAMLKRLKK